MKINEFFDDVVRYVTCICHLSGYDLMKIFKVDSMQFKKHLYPELDIIATSLFREYHFVIIKFYHLKLSHHLINLSTHEPLLLSHKSSVTCYISRYVYRFCLFL